MIYLITRFFTGILLGAGAILPGISSGVICVILGIYDKLITSITNIFKDFKTNFYYLLPFIIGGIFGILLLGNILQSLLNIYPMQTQFCFIGLILGSIPSLIKEVNSKHTFKIKYLAFTLISFIIGFILVIIENKLALITSNYVSTSYLILSGLLMSIGVIVPGISNTLILMCLGVYPIYLSSIATLNFNILIPMGIGLIIGSIICIAVIKFLFNKFYMPTYYSIIGFTLGSILILYTPISFDLTSYISILLLFIGFLFAHNLEKINK